MADQNELNFILKMQDQTSSAMAGFTSSMSELTATIQQQMAAMNQLTSALQGHVSGTHMAASAVHEHAAAHEHAGKSAHEHAEEELAVGRSLERIATQAKEAAEALVGLWASNEMARSTIEAAEETEKAIMAIGRASGLSREEVEGLHEELANLSMKDGNATIDQMDKMALSAARMGASKEQMQAFSETLSKITNAGNYQQVTSGIEQILRATGEGAEGVEKLGDALAAMEVHSAHGIEGLIPLMGRLSGKATELGLSSEHIAAYAAAFETMGGRPEMTVMAFERTMAKLKETAQLGGRQLSDLAAQTGMTAAEFQKMTAAHPEDALLKLLQVVHELHEQGKDPVNFLSRLGIGDEQAGSIQNMAEHIKEIKANINSADNSGGAADKMAKETKTEFDKTLNSMTTAWTEFKTLVGGDVMVAAIDGFKAATVTIQALTSVVQNTNPVMRGLIEAFVIGTPAILGTIKIVGALSEAFSGAMETVALMGGRITALFKSNAKAATEASAEVVAAEETATAAAKRSVGQWAGVALGWGIAASAAWDLGTAIGKLAQQMINLHTDGASWGDMGTALNPFAGKDALLKKMQAELDERRKNGTETEADRKIDERTAGLKKTADEREASGADRKPADTGDRNKAVGEAITARDELNEKVRQSLLTLDTYGKKLEELGALQRALDTARKTAMEGGKSDFSPQQLDLMQQRLNAEKAMADPLNAQARAMGDAVAKANAFTKAQQEALSVALQIRKLEEEGLLDASTPNDAAHNNVRSDMAAADNAARAKSFQEQLIAMNNQLVLAGTLNARDKERLQINQQLETLQRTMGLDDTQVKQLDAILTKTKEIEAATAQFKSLNPQAEALRSYNEQLDLLNKRLAEHPDQSAEIAQEKQRLDQQTLAARNPLGNIAQQEKEELDQLKVVGAYREADLKTLQQITELKHQGIELSKQEAGQLSANNRNLQDIKNMQTELDGLTSTFGSGLSNAISGALAGNRHAFSQFGLSLGKKMMDDAFSALSKNMSGALTGAGGPLSGLFGAGKDGVDKLGAMGKDQMDKTITTAQATITATNVIVNGAVQGSANATAAGANPSMPSAGSQAGTYGGLMSSPFLGTDNGGNMSALSTGGHIPINWRNNNPGNIRSAAFSARQGGYTGMNGGFATFDNAADGYRAANKNLDSYARQGINTPASIINKWAPAGDNNDPVAYAKRVSQMTGLDANAPIGNDPETRAKLLKAITEVEGGKKSPYSSDQIAGFLGGKGQNDNHVQAIAKANDPMTKALVAAGKTSQEQFSAAAKAGGDSLKTELIKANTDIGADFKTKVVDAANTGATDKLSPGAANSPLGQPAIDPTAAADASGGAAASAQSGLFSMLSKVPMGQGAKQGVGLLQSLLGLFTGGGGSAGLMHTGGVVGSGFSMSRNVNPAIFLGARRFHDGLGDDEFPAILQKGERVLTQNQDQRASAAMSRMADMVANSNRSSPTGTQPIPSERQAGPRMTMIVNTPNASSFRSSQSQIMATQHAALARMGAKHN